MNSFGLGLVLNFVDNASAGMNSATQNFLRMSTTADSMTSSVSASATEMAAIAFSLSAVGDTFTSIGESIIGVFTGITQSVIDTGGQMLNYRMQLSALYGSTEAGEAKLAEIKKYAMQSVFEVSSLIPAVTMMKAVGIEAMDEITTSSGGATQRLLDYASDLAAMMPQMRNVYGTGVNAAMGAFKEYIAEGNALTLKRGAGLDITAILGEAKGATVEERTQQVADLIEKLNIVGYTANLAGTPMQRLSNMQDALFNSLSKIADSGVFEAYCVLLETLSDWVFELVENEESFNAITGVLADTITTVLAPLQSMLDWVVKNGDAIVEWVKENPKLTKNILLTVAAIGAFLIVGGSLLKLLSSIAFAMSGLQMLKNIPFLFSKMVVAVLPFIALAGIAYTAWKNNMGGIQDTVVTLMNNLGDIFSILGDAWGDSTISEENFLKAKELGILPFISGILQLKYYWDYFIEGFKTGFTSFFESFTRVMSAMGIDVSKLGQALADFLTRLAQPGAEEEWNKLGEAMGALVAIMTTLSLFTNIIIPIAKAFIYFGKAVSFVGKAFKPILQIFKWIGIAGKAVIAFFGDMGAAIALMKEGFGFFEVMGVWFPKLAGFFTKTGVLFTKIGGWFVKIGVWFTKFGGWIVSSAKAIGSAIMGVLTAVASFLGLPVWAVVAIIAAIVAVISLIVVFRKEVAQFFSWLWSKITDFCSWLGGIIADFFTELWGTLTGWFSNIIAKVKEVISNIVQAILSNPIVQSVIKVMQSIYNCIATVVKTIIAYIKGVATTIWNIIKLVGTIVAGVAKVIWSVISGIASVIWTCIKGLVNFIVTCVQGIWNVIKKVVNFIWTLIKTVANIIKSIVNAIYQFIRMVFLAILALGKLIINGIVSAFKWLWSKIKPILQSIGDFFSKIFNWVKNSVVMPVVNWITNAFTKVKNWITGILQSIADFFASIFDWINTNVLTPFYNFIISVFDWINEKITAVTDWFSEAFTSAADAITGVFEGVKEFFAGVWESITEGAENFFNWISEKLEWLTDTLSSVGEFFGGAIDNAGNWFKDVGDKLANFVGLDTGGYVKATGIAVLHPNEVVVNDDTTKRLQNFLGQYENNTVSGIVRESTPTQAVMNNIYPTVMESVPVTTIPAEEISNVSNNSSFIANNTQNFVTQKPIEVIEKAGETHNDYSVTFTAGSIVIQLANTSDAELEKTAEKLMKIIARKQQLRAMAVRV